MIIEINTTLLQSILDFTAGVEPCSSSGTSNKFFGEIDQLLRDDGTDVHLDDTEPLSLKCDSRNVRLMTPVTHTFLPLSIAVKCRQKLYSCFTGRGEVLRDRF